MITTITEKKYAIQSKSGDANCLTVSLIYNTGGYNAFTGKTVTRGYYLSLTPETCNRGFSSYTAFSGLSIFIFEVKRKSKSASKRALSWAEANAQDWIDRFCKDHGYKIC